jgi:hypothetical protein
VDDVDVNAYRKIVGHLSEVGFSVIFSENDLACFYLAQLLMDKLFCQACEQARVFLGNQISR